MALGALTVLIAAGATLLFALEGALCVAMALPIAVPLGMLGARIGEQIAQERRDSAPAAALLLLALPFSAAIDARLQNPPLREVLTSIEIDAPPQQVWPHVLGFADLDEPPEWFFRLGIAYPLRARLEGTGVGAVRKCEFSTGPSSSRSPPGKSRRASPSTCARSRRRCTNGAPTAGSTPSTCSTRCRAGAANSA